MSGEYTPTTDDVAEAWAARYDGEHTSASGDERRGYEAEFDRWLTQYTAEVRAAALAEQDTKEPDWEYGYTSKWGTIAAASQADAESRAADHARGITEARESGDLEYHGKVVKRIATPKAGPWMPVEGEAG